MTRLSKPVITSLEKPEPMVCPFCNRSTDWIWHEKEAVWNLQGPWWYIQGIFAYIDSEECYIKALEKWNPEDIVIEVVK